MAYAFGGDTPPRSIWPRQCPVCAVPRRCEASPRWGSNTTCLGSAHGRLGQWQVDRLCTSYRISQALFVSAKLGIADGLKDGPKSSDALATAVGADPDALHRLLRVIASVGVCAQVDQRRFTLPPVGALLQTGVPGSLWGHAVLTGEWWWRAYEGLLYSVRTGKSAHEQVYGMGVFKLAKRDV